MERKSCFSKYLTSSFWVVFFSKHVFSDYPYEKISQRVLYLQMMDWDRFSRNDPIGEVNTKKRYFCPRRLKYKLYICVLRCFLLVTRYHLQKLSSKKFLQKFLLRENRHHVMRIAEARPIRF